MQAYFNEHKFVLKYVDFITFYQIKYIITDLFIQIVLVFIV